ncbi:Phosphoglycolate phosphatase [Streptomyces sp. S4.7]|uniref:HAD family hydrolase n=1 Tax=Streptomyces sp. S4.7 TaxID=2705439 RepID=UPI00139711D8|nr:haloacid dehalogenase-like hydrolase [Streptomyces sp. S4.7]QHY99244.1 Phosphoglycolate phosphatase [Streptomyces sp. S4.7]
MILVLWDIDRTLLYVGETDRLVYREVFQQVVGRPPAVLPARGTGVTMPLAVRELLASNDVPSEDIERLTGDIIERMPGQLANHREDLLTQGQLMPGALAALVAVRQSDLFIPSIVTGNLRRSAEIKLDTFGLSSYVDSGVGGYASDNSHRPALVRIAQERAEKVYGEPFDRSNTVIVGDSLQDVITGREGGAPVIGVASGKTPAAELTNYGADRVIPDLTDVVGLLQLITDVVRSE